MNRWGPHVTVACVIEQDGKYLMVEERDKFNGKMVFNQPAGHLEEGESLTDAALRETLEETGWVVQLIGVLCVALHHAPSTDITYHRTTFLATPMNLVENAVIDPDIHAVHWLDYESILARSDRMRSAIAIKVIDLHRGGVSYPLDLIQNI